MEQNLSTRLRKQLGGPRDGALLRFSIGSALLAEGGTEAAVDAFRAAIGFDPHYSAAWKMLAGALAASGDVPSAIASYESGIAVAHARGDLQAEKEMQVFLRRLRKRGEA